MKINLQSRQKLVIGNWKMYGNLKKNANLMHKLIKELKCFKAIDIVLCIPFPYLSQAEGMLKKSHIKWGSQNVSQFEEGAYTGSISAQMIKDFKCQYAIIGHSERRALSSETYQSATNRFIQALHAHITPIFCVGETAEEKN